MIDTDFEEMLKKVQKKIQSEEEATYSTTVINEYRNPTMFGKMKNPDTMGMIKGSCGDTMRFELKIRNDIISDIRFWTDGCGASIACGNMLAKMAFGKNLREVESITQKLLLNSLNGLPSEHIHCSNLAVNTLRLSIKQYR